LAERSYACSAQAPDNAEKQCYFYSGAAFSTGQTLECKHPLKEIAMPSLSIIRATLVCMCIAAALAGCKKAEAPPAPALDSSSSSSVAAPTAAVPASPATTPPATTDSGNASSMPQSTPAELSKEQESSAMPMPGQVNNHSTTAPEEEKK
jgi:hypothetical protein